MLRVIAGKYRNRKVNQPSKETTRSTIEKIREAIFSSIAFKLPDKSFLDLFSGSGIWSIEASSRGASQVVGIEKDRKAYKIILENINSIKMDNISIKNMDAMEFIKNNTMVFDFIFIDPPFIRYDYINDSLKFIQENKSLSEDGEIILHTDDYRQVVVPEKLKIYKEKRYGKKFIYFIVWK